MAIDLWQLLDRLEGLHTHRVYSPADIADLLAQAGVDAVVGVDGQSVVIAGIEVRAVEPEWGDAGITPQSVLSVLFTHLLGTAPRSQMIGRGFWYRDVLRQLRHGLAEWVEGSR